MKTEESLSKGIIKRIVFIAIVIILLMGAGVFASVTRMNTVTIQFSDSTELSVLTSKSKVSDILKENNIVILEDEEVVPSLDSNIDSAKVIKIQNKNDMDIAESQKEEATIVSTDIIDENATLVEKIVVEQEKIPYETVKKEVSIKKGDKTTSTVVQKGKNGIKEITYKVKYENDKEIERTKISEKVIKKPVDKIVEVRKKVVTARGSGAIRATGTKAEYQAYAKARCKALGWSDYDFDCLVSLWNKESKWNPNAHNSSSGAHGIPQALPASKMASHGSDYMTNYKTQINWGLSYIKGRYGTPTKAWIHSCSKGWY